MASRNPEDIFPHAGGDHDNDDDEVGDIILDAGETDEQLVTSSNQDADSAAGNVSTATSISWYLPFSLMTMIFAKIVATT